MTETTSPNRLLLRALDVMFLGALALYIVAGIALVPFHGDESTIIYMSRDWFRYAAGDFDSMTLRLPPPDNGYAAEQHLRLLNGVASKYLIGLFWDVRGGTMEGLPDQWYWGLDWDYNLNDGHIPTRDLLITSRVSSAIPTALALPFIFLIGLRLGGHKVAYPAALIYALMPVVLLNGRRAMFEGALLFASALLIYASMLAAHNLKRKQHIWLSWALVGVAAGLAVASKHTAAFLVIPAFLPLLTYGPRKIEPILYGAALSVALMGGIVFVLNPAWWADPVSALRLIAQMRTGTLRAQEDQFGTFTDLPSRIAAPFTANFGAPQFYEDPTGWPTWIAGEIEAYAPSPLAGVPIGGPAGAALVAAGVYAMWKKRLRSRFPEAAAQLLRIAGFLFVVLYASNSLPWWRYYMPLSIPFALIAAAGAAFLAESAWRAARHGARRSAQ